MTSSNLQFNPREFLDRCLAWLSPLKKDPPGLVEAVVDAKKAWIQALNLFNTMDSKMVDFAIYNLNASERHYMALVAEAKRTGVTAWPETLNDIVTLDSPGTTNVAQTESQAAPEHAAHN